MKDYIFKVGDRIKTNRSRGSKNLISATIIALDDIYQSIVVRFDDQYKDRGNKIGNNCGYCRRFNITINDDRTLYWMIYTHDIVIDKIANTRTARKIYQNRIYQQNKEYLWISPN